MANNILSNIWVKTSNWEYWPAWLFNIPVGVMWLYQAARCRSIFFFSRVNPAIETGGFFSEEKWPIYQMFQPSLIPSGVLIQDGFAVDKMLALFQRSKLTFPVLVKPNIGERGMGIKKIGTLHDLNQYHSAAAYDFIIQEFIDLPCEMSVLAYRIPNTSDIAVTSVCLKEKLTLVGDGNSTLDQLAIKHYRSRVQWPRLRDHFDSRIVLNKDEKLLLEPIGNHSRGTTFLDGNELINEPFRSTIEKLFNSIKADVQYGRFDIIYESIVSFNNFKFFKVIEFNGVGSEPAHIYQPGFSLLRAYSVLWRHACILGDISLDQKSKGKRVMSWSNFFHALKVYKNNLRLVSKINF